MIDYEKLKLAHSLGDKLHFGDWTITHSYGIDKYFILDFTGDDGLWCKEDFKSIDDLIIRLQELTQPKAKYEKNDFIWILDDSNAPAHKKIIGHRWDNYEKEYVCELTDSFGEPYWITESSLHPTKQSLIESQIEYWQSLREIQPGLEGITGPIDYYPAFEGPMQGFDAKYATSEEGQYKIREGLRQLIKENQRDYKTKDPNNDDCYCDEKSNGYRGCGHCGYPDKECQHESDGYSYITNHKPQVHSKKCLKCGELYR